MDRKIVFAGGMLTALTAVYCARSIPEERAPQRATAYDLDEPGLLPAADIQARQLLPAAPSRVVATAFPFFGGKTSAPAEKAGPELIMPGDAVPSLSVTAPPVIELPSASATPDLPIPKPTSQPLLPPAVAAPVEAQGPVQLPVRAPAQVPSDFAFEQPQAIPTAAEPAVEVAAALARVQALTAYGRSLSERGATYSARTQFVQALRELAEAHDEVESTLTHTQALNTALRAIEESCDFERRDTLSPDRLDVTRIVAGHRSEVLKGQDTSQMRPGQAIEICQQYAIERLTIAVNHTAAASLPMYGLGRISAAAASSKHQAVARDAADAVVWYQAALQIEPCNAAVAHELGTLYARRGQWQLAKSVLQRAVTLKPHPTTWSNLAVVHHKLGEEAWAQAAQSHVAPSGGISKLDGRIPPVTWVDPETFAKSTGPNEAYFPQQTPPPSAASQSPTAGAPRSASKPKASLSWLPWSKTKNR